MILTKRYYQCVDKTDPNMGKVYELLYIDDIQPDMVIYYMSDGMKVNESYIGLIGVEAISSNMLMVEVSNPTNIWKIEKHELKAKQMTAKGADGQEYVIPDLSMTNTAGKEVQDGITVFFYPPKPYKLPLPDLDNWRISTIIQKLNSHEELENPEIMNVIPEFYFTAFVKGYKSEKTVSKAPVKEPEPVVEETVVPEVSAAYLTTDEIFQHNTQDLIYETGTVRLNDEYFYSNDMTVNDPKYTIRVSDVPGFGIQKDEEAEVRITIDDVDYSLQEIRDFIQTAKAVSVPDEPVSETDEFVRNLIQRAHKEDAVTNISLIMQLPSFATFKLIYEAYGDEIGTGFVERLASMVPYEVMIDAVAKGLKDYYKYKIEDTEPEEPVDDDTPES